MKQILWLLPLFISATACGQWTIINGKQRFVKGLGLPTIDTAVGIINDTSQLVLRPQDSSLWYKYKTQWRKLSTGGGSSNTFGSGLTQTGSLVELGGIANSTLLDFQIANEFRIKDARNFVIDLSGTELLRIGQFTSEFGRGTGANRTTMSVQDDLTGFSFGQLNSRSDNPFIPQFGDGYVNVFPNRVELFTQRYDTTTFAVTNESSIAVDQDSIGMKPQSGLLNIDTLAITTDTTGKYRIVWSPTTGRVEALQGVGQGGSTTITSDTAKVVIAKVHNAETTTLTRGTVVYLWGASGDIAAVKRANNKQDATSAATLGFVREPIAAGDTGYVTISGQIDKLNLGSYTSGQLLWLDSLDGQFTSVKPTAPYHGVFLGVVERANAGNGLAYVKVQNGQELGEIHDVKLTSPTNNQVLAYTQSTDLWENKSINTVIGYTPADNSLVVKYTDTALMLNPYLRKVDTLSLSNRINTKQNAVTLTTTGSSGAATFNQSTGALNIPQYGGTGGSGFGYTLLLGHNSTSFTASNTFVSGAFYGSNAILLFDNRPSRWIIAPKVGTIVSASIISQLNATTYASPSSSTMIIRLNNLTQGTSSTIDAAYPIGSSLSWSGSPPAKNDFYTLGTPMSVNAGDRIQIQIVTPAWTTAPAAMSQNFLLFVE